MPDMTLPLPPDNPLFTLAVLLAFGALWAWLVPVALFVIGAAALAGRVAFLGPLLLRALPLWLVSVAWIGQPGWPWHRWHPFWPLSHCWAGSGTSSLA